MAYQRFKIAELSSPPATLATFATLRPEEGRNVASVATVAEPAKNPAGRTVATVAEARRAAVEPGETPPAQNCASGVAPKSDAELYAEALRRIEPCGNGPVAAFLGWGMTRAANAETVLREAGRIKYDHTGRGVFVAGPIPSQATGEKS